MNVLSLFDGMSCGQLALKRTGIKVNNYYSSEIDKVAIKVTQQNFPGTIQLGSVTEVTGDQLPHIDLLIGGSPCQGFSVAGTGLSFDHPQSKLFFEYVRLLKEIRVKNPDVKFLLENVKMRVEWQNIITQYLGVEPIKLNSALVSAQNRNRIYWTNIPGILAPDDKGIKLKDVLDSEIDGKYYLTEEQIEKVKMVKGAKCINREKNGYRYQFKEGAVPFPNALTGKAQCMVAQGQSVSSRTTTFVQDDKGIRRLTPVECERLQTVPDGYTSSLTDTQVYKLLGNGWTVDMIAYIFSFINK